MSARPFGISTGAYFPDLGDWPTMVRRASEAEWPYVELAALLPGELERLGPYLATAPAELDRFERVSIHAPVRDGADTLGRLPAGFDTILHPNVYADANALGRHAVFENMDVQKDFGRFTSDLASVFDRNPEAGFCLDVAHVWTNDGSLALGHELLDAFGDRLRQLHVSGIEPDGTHRPTTGADLALYEPLLDRCRHVPWLLEAQLA
jgi:sugar phosphate isomerase/epimerase